MTISAVHAGKIFVDILGNNDAKVRLDEIGAGTFPVNGGGISVYVNEEIVEKMSGSVEEQAME